MIKIEGLYKDYKVGKVLFPALRGVDLAIQDGEFTAVAGPSGSGKTTLLNVIGCLDSPTKGQVFIDETEITALSTRKQADLRKRKIGFVFQTFNLIPVLTAYENVEMPLILLDMSEKERNKRIIAIIGEVGLSEYLHRRPNEMSGGQQQRVAIARALVKNPTIVLADEPTANLDSVTAQEILELMETLNQKYGTTFIFSTHDKLVMDFAKRLVTLRDGRVAGEGRGNAS